MKITKKNFQDEELPHELLLTKETKKKNAFANMLTDVKFSKGDMFKII